ncbi:MULTISPECIES: hypothetical protein [Mumia]|uniref:hypothetical protein n=1 Tax=Mumia TaxID=1546255 RepID=UPI00141EDA28|nr:MULTISPECIES: hypothetical protein [unclassified Mumia]QMW67641.1 hypothetical protein H4N58_07115 [Mumia sp. ZJ1417]
MDLSSDSADGARNRLVLKIVLGLVGAGIAMGLIFGFAGASAIRALGFKAEPTPSAPAASEETDEPEEPTETTPAPTTPPPTTSSPKPKDPRFEASSDAVGPGERIEFTGRAPELGAGSTLQVQRREGQDGEWGDFPVTATTRKGGTFSTWIVTSRTGSWEFRVVGDGFTSPSARVEIG